MSCVVIPKISGNCPLMTIDISHLNIPKHIRLADPDFYKPGETDLLIGAGVYLNLLCIGQVSLGTGLPTLQKTRYGWVVGGEINIKNSVVPKYCNFVSNNELHNQLINFWNIEETSSNERVFSLEEKQCEKLFSDTTKRDSEGRFVVRIPFKRSVALLGDSKQQAINRFKSLERKLQANCGLRERYVQFMNEYLTLGHMRKLKNTGESSDIQTYYFPHHCVINEKSPTTKLRVVFDGSAQSDTGVSLNELQIVGPTLQDDLFSIVVRFRQHNIVVCADIVKMYRQIKINPKQWCLQRILWREDPKQTLETYELTTVTYGTASAPYLAVKCLQQLAHEYEISQPEVSKIISKDFYMDDLLTGADSVEAAIKLCDDITVIPKTASFDLQKWSSNNVEVLNHLRSTFASKGVLVFNENEKTKTLGLYWSGERDVLMYSIPENREKTPVTKRTVLSEIAKIFDPLGLLGACIIVSKIIMQQLWLCKLSWDESLPSDLDSKWRTFREDLPLLNHLEIPRHVVVQHPVTVELHGFADASLTAYGACVYIRSVSESNEITVRLLCSKTKVAPLKQITIPRLELCAAVVLANLVDKVKKCMSLKFDACVYWSDSTVCLNWIQTPPNILQPFVGNRVAQIQSLCHLGDWNHIRTNNNPADLLSRGVNPSKLINCELWWMGPSWLSKSKEEWPVSTFEREPNMPELKMIQKIFTIEKVEGFPISKFSSLSKLIRVCAYCVRFINLCRSKSKGTGEPLLQSELQYSLETLLKLVQKEMFFEEMQKLLNHETLKKGCLLKLNPFLDESRFLRVGGRLALSEYEYDKKHPIVLLSNHYFTKLLFRDEHQRLLHAGPQLLLASVREKYWPVGGRNLARKIVHDCVRCFRVKPVIKNPIMGLLPSDRIIPAPPFSTCGVDYAGPLLIKNKKGRGSVKIKCYIALFICFVTKAIHIELVTELTKEAFLSAFKRFIARRGKPLTVYSDNGTNFLGAKNELEALGLFLKQNSNNLIELINNQGVNWKFIPAFSPHFGGIWEAGVKSCKAHLKRVLGNACLTFEGLYTVLTEIEATLNSRPLTPLSCDPNDLNPLTPAHFLIGRSLTALPEKDLRHEKESRLSYYERLKQLNQHFWARWSLEYISELQVRQKWHASSKQVLQPGALVVIKEDNSPPLQWTLGRIETVHAGPDGIARVATVKTMRGSVKRSFAKLCVLPVDFV